MKKSILKFLNTPHLGDFDLEQFADLLIEHICTPEFTALYARRTCSEPSPGLDITLSQLEKTMSALTDAMTALGQQIAAANSASNAAHLQAIDDHLTKLDTEEGADEATIADTTAGLQALGG
jgi:DNA-binding FrmR family transcriptional regulator